MTATAPEYEDGQLALLEARERELTRMLAETQAEISELRARFAAIASPTEGQRLPLTEAATTILPALGEPEEEEAEQPPHLSRPYIMLQPLEAHDPLRAKWELGISQPMPESVPHSTSLSQASPTANVASSGTLRLIGLMASGKPWESRIPFSRIAQEGGIIIGRAADAADVVVDETTVSRSHACLELSDAGLVVTDLGSTNGMRLNEQRITPYERQIPLHDGDTIALGDARLLIEIIP